MRRVEEQFKASRAEKRAKNLLFAMFDPQPSFYFTLPIKSTYQSGS